MCVLDTATEEESSSPASVSAAANVSSAEVDSETFAINWYEIFH